ncbi:glycine/betaine ABC transporter substrate-binding protein [Serinicoccus chungangensis]|uniref:Glycine/betaine ABC transporter substrate-binding protein n=1 Tax=Serinicoccus chungangensis TaxID=767452 RepID=A0A0W8I473_9MICO|nr:ABC transporter substrate-binding protein [Serinicoccus chungangensis]KUG52833.1 glycine/betaine ABC transporter substrate-binding protein [Serinicoccus chungangensis]
MRRTAVITLALSATLGLAACGGGSDPMDTGGDSDAGGSEDAGAGSITIGSANFPENELLAEIYAAALSDAGVDVDTQLNIGSREAYIAGIQDGSIDALPEYSGGLATYLNPEITATSSEDVLADLQENLPDDLQVLEISEAENKDSLVVTGETAEELGLTTIGDLSEHAGDMTLGGPPEFETRPNGVDGLQEVYGLEFGSFRSLAAGANLTVQSLANGQVDVANIFTTNPAVEENGFVVLEDPESLFAAQNIVPLLRADAVNPTIEETLNEVSAALNTENLTSMMVQVQTEGQDPAEVAREFVDGNL